MGECVKSCAPTLSMLLLNESPVVTLSEGKFGTETGLVASKTAPEPKCTTMPALLRKGWSVWTINLLSLYTR